MPIATSASVRPATRAPGRIRRTRGSAIRRESAARNRPWRRRPNRPCRPAKHRSLAGPIPGRSRRRWMPPPRIKTIGSFDIRPLISPGDRSPDVQINRPNQAFKPPESGNSIAVRVPGRVTFRALEGLVRIDHEAAVVGHRQVRHPTLTGNGSAAGVARRIEADAGHDVEQGIVARGVGRSPALGSW